MSGYSSKLGECDVEGKSYSYEGESEMSRDGWMDWDEEDDSYIDSIKRVGIREWKEKVELMKEIKILCRLCELEKVEVCDKCGKGCDYCIGVCGICGDCGYDSSVGEYVKLDGESDNDYLDRMSGDREIGFLSCRSCGKIGWDVDMLSNLCLDCRKLKYVVVWRSLRFIDGVGNGGYGVDKISDDSFECWDMIWKKFGEYMNEFGGSESIVKVDINVGFGIEIENECEWVIVEYKEIVR